MGGDSNGACKAVFTGKTDSYCALLNVSHSFFLSISVSHSPLSAYTSFCCVFASYAFMRTLLRLSTFLWKLHLEFSALSSAFKAFLTTWTETLLADSSVNSIRRKVMLSESYCYLNFTRSLSLYALLSLLLESKVIVIVAIIVITPTIVLLPVLLLLHYYFYPYHNDYYYVATCNVQLLLVLRWFVSNSGL